MITPILTSKKRPERKQNILFLFSIFMFIVISAAAGILDFTLSDFVRGHVIRMHGEFYAKSLASSFSTAFLSGNIDSFTSIQSELEKKGQLSHIKHLAAWNNSGILLFGDTTVFTSQMSKNPLGKALNGLVQFIYLTDTNTVLHPRLRGELALFLPIKDLDGIVLGVVALHESDEVLAMDLDKAGLTIALYIGLAGFSIYGALFFLFYQSYRRQRKATEHIRLSQESIIFAMSSLSSLRDQETGGHLERCSEYVRLLAGNLRYNKKFSAYIDGEYIRELAGIAPLHDIGKVGIDDAILRKPGKLTEDEFEVMKTHSALGAEILREARKRLPFSSSLELAIELTRHHHERWDGTGYPDSLKGDDIPLSARIMAVADVYDALRSERYYKKPLSHVESVRIIEIGSGSQFDPEIIKVFTKCHKYFETVFG